MTTHTGRRIQTAIVAALLLTVAVVASSCTSSGPDARSPAPGPETPDAPIPTAEVPMPVSMDDPDGRQFTSVSVTRDDADPALVPGTQVSLTFDDGGVHAGAGCNTLYGGTRIENGELELDGPLVSTAMGCPDALFAQDEWLSGFLASRPTVVLAGDILTLTQGSTTIVLSDARSTLPVEPPPR